MAPFAGFFFLLWRCRLEAIDDALMDPCCSQRDSDSLYALLSRPPIHGRVAGIGVDHKRLWVWLLDEEQGFQHKEFSENDLPGLIAWLRRREARHVGVARLGSGSGRSLSALLKALANQGLTIEPVREAGLMKQARKGAKGKGIKAAAAQVVAWRLKDPLRGYADLAADELGLGEYLDQVDSQRLKAALEDRPVGIGPSLLSSSKKLVLDSAYIR